MSCSRPADAEREASALAKRGTLQLLERRARAPSSSSGGQRLHRNAELVGEVRPRRPAPRSRRRAGSAHWMSSPGDGVPGQERLAELGGERWARPRAGPRRRARACARTPARRAPAARPRCGDRRDRPARSDPGPRRSGSTATRFASASGPSPTRSGSRPSARLTSSMRVAHVLGARGAGEHDQRVLRALAPRSTR